jgi:hypothetical protein
MRTGLPRFRTGKEKARIHFRSGPLLFVGKRAYFLRVRLRVVPRPIDFANWRRDSA